MALNLEADNVGDADTDAEPHKFPYPLGTKIARDFGEAGIFWDTIVELYPDDPNLCHIRFTDGDTEDLDVDEVQYAVDLYKQEFDDN